MAGLYDFSALETPFVGRRKEKKVLEEFFASRGGILGISGLPGSGKSRLVEEAARHQKGYKLIRVEVFQAQDSLGVLREIVAELAGIREPEQAHERIRAHCSTTDAELLTELYQPNPKSQFSREAKDSMMIDAAINMIAGYTRKEGRAGIWFDNAENSKGQTAEIIKRIAGRSAEGYHVITCSRDPIEWVESRLAVGRLTLDSQIREVAEGLTGKRVGKDTLRRIRKLSGGNPLAIRLAAAFLASGAGDDGGIKDLEDLIIASTERLSKNKRKVLGMIAAYPEAAEPKTLFGAFHDYPKSALHRTIASMINEGILFVQDGRIDTHPYMREITERQMTAEEKARFSSAHFRALGGEKLMTAKEYSGELSTLSMMLALANKAGKLMGSYLCASITAGKAATFSQAKQALESAIAAFERALEPYRQESSGLIKGVESENVVKLNRLEYALGELMTTWDNDFVSIEKVIGSLERRNKAVVEARLQNPDALMLLLYLNSFMARHYRAHSEYALAMRHHKAALRMSRKLGKNSPYKLWACQNLNRAHFEMAMTAIYNAIETGGGYEECRKCLDRMNKRKGVPASLAAVRSNLQALCSIGTGKPARAEIEEALQAAGGELQKAGFMLTLAEWHYASGQYGEALKVCQNALEPCLRYGGEAYRMAEAYLLMARAACRLGRKEEGEQYFSRAKALSETTKPFNIYGLHQRILQAQQKV